jgi:hypothetical protein
VLAIEAAPWSAREIAPPAGQGEQPFGHDILSFLVTHQDLGLSKDETDQDHLYLTNAYVSNDEFFTPLLFSWPVTAHTGYFQNNTVLNTFLCGMKDGVVQPCPESH